MPRKNGPPEKIGRPRSRPTAHPDSILGHMGEMIRQRREELGLTLTQAVNNCAPYARFTVKSWSEYERGQHDMGIIRFFIICLALGVKPQAILPEYLWEAVTRGGARDAERIASAFRDPQAKP